MLTLSNHAGLTDHIDTNKIAEPKQNRIGRFGCTDKAPKYQAR
jgi:hypothetical protein